MARLRTREQLEQERLDTARYALGNITLDTTRLLLIYARQSTSRQYVNNIYSALEQRDGLLERATELGWWSDELRILYVENQLAKKTHVSGSLRIDQRPGLQALTEVIESGKASAVLVVSVDRITRDPDMVTPTMFANLCKRYNVLIITDDYTYDFNNPTRDDMGRFMNEAIASKEYVRKQIRGKMLKNRTRKANMGRVANGVAPVGLMLDASKLDEKGKPYSLVPSPHADRVNYLYTRYRSLGANLATLYREVVSMAASGTPIFPDNPMIDEGTIRLTRVEGGWTVASRTALKYILTNPMYAGHLVFNGRVVKRNAHPAIVDPDLWEYAFNKLATTDLDGNPIEHGEKSVRYAQKGSANTALLAGTRDNGKLVIDSTNGAHVYYNRTNDIYVIRKLDARSVNGYVTRIEAFDLDGLVANRVLFWCRTLEPDCTYLESEQCPEVAMDRVDAAVPPKGPTGIQSDLALTNQELARVTRALDTSQHVMDDATLTDHFASKARLIKRRAELEGLIANEDRMRQKLASARDDIESANVRWEKWTIDERRQFIRLVTDSITLEELAPGWLRLVIVWSPLMGFTWPGARVSVVDTGYIWRRGGEAWTNADLTRLREAYPTGNREELLHMFPTRSWLALARQAELAGVRREVVGREVLSVPNDMSLSDYHLIKEFALQPGKHVQWEHEFRRDDVSNRDYSS
ncbi:MAG TPA: recombinase family protein [Ktedonobacteraceae bacterium]